ncbi:hypothetical protein DRP43_00755 [candidate division TA06 bacterium]|uniref:PASTA domain-containing protein n=1 Tax=candidate division TA06 bacterium TaxID=2250710 RepID=A0A660SNR2_UNCT6|nr:MAG: hypothetical protein DRP43_00755 [candidate division TA06 bacterium]
MKSDKKSKRKSNPFVGISIAIVSFVVGFFIVNYLIMPIIVGKGEDTLVPSLVGLNIKDAQKIIRHEGLTLDITGYQYDTVYQKDRIIYQDPKPDEITKKGRKITAIVSRGIKANVMPYIIGIPLSNAIEVLKSKNINNGINKIFTSSDSVPRNYIVSTIPDADESIFPSMMITVFISKGSESDTLSMPNITGLSFIETLNKVKSLNLILGNIECEDNIDSVNSKVILQYPEEGDMISPGDSVNIVLHKE